MADSELETSSPIISGLTTTEPETEDVVTHNKQLEYDDDEDEEPLDIDDKDFKTMMGVEYTYPLPADPEFQSKIYKKREFYYHKMPGRSELNDYKSIKDYRDKVCSRKFALLEHQSFLSNFINPDTPYRGVLIFHGTGTGKCVSKDTIVHVNGLPSMTAEMIWSVYNSGIMYQETDTETWCMPKDTLVVTSLVTPVNSLCRVPIKHMFRQRINETVRQIILDNGLTITITNAHKLFTDSHGWTNQLEPGLSVAVPWSNGIREGRQAFDDRIRFVRISAVNNIHYNDYVYDFEIPTYHNYVANGIICHNTCASIAIAEKFKDMVQKYNTKIYVLVSGPLIKDNWKDQLMLCTKETYLKMHDATQYVNEADLEKEKKKALAVALQYYRFMSYRSFYKKVLGEKIRDEVKDSEEKVKVSYRKTKEGEFERDIAIDRIYNLNNSLIIIDEAHNLTGNAYGDALMKVIKDSVNLKVVLLTATPMKNLGSDIIQLLNFIRPPNFQLERDRIFTSHTNHEMEFKEGGVEYLKKMAQGYVSYLRGADPLTFAKRDEKGVIPKGLMFTKVIPCTMSKFQRSVYDNAIREKKEDSLDRKSEAVANFAFPGLSKDKKDIMGFYGNDGITMIKNQLKSDYELLNKKIAVSILKEKEQGDVEKDLIYLSEGGKTITGSILKFHNLKHFSIKFYKALKKLNRLVWGRKGARNAFVYSNLVKVGIEMFMETLLQNGYLEYDDNPNNYKITPDTICYFCGKTHKEHVQRKLVETEKSQMGRVAGADGSESSTEYDKKVGEVPFHNFAPATFISITGKSTEEAVEVIQEDKIKVLQTVFNSSDNIEGKYIKLVLGSRVMNEGISLRNVSEVHILDVYFNLGKVDQVIGRAIRHCSHYQIMDEKTPYPGVKVYKYSVTLGSELSSEEEMYKKAELKYILVKKVERALKQVSIDCPLNRFGNIFPEELTKFKNCVSPAPGKEIKPGDVMCPAICDYIGCNFQCNDPYLNDIYWNPKDNAYNKIDKKDIDYSTFVETLARSEIETVKGKIKEMYKLHHVYTLQDIIKYVKNSYEGEKKELFEDFFCFKALDELIPISENDFNNFKDTVFDKFNKPGYLIYINKYYIFQPFDQNTNVPMYYRSTFDRPMENQLSLHNYLKNSEKYKQIKGPSTKKEKETDPDRDKNVHTYDFESVMDYYDSRNEYKYVGIIDKEPSKLKTDVELNDVFKIREKRSKILEKKRATGIPSITGAVCYSSKSKEYLEKIAETVGVKPVKGETRIDLCEKIKERLLFLEKTGTSEKKDKMTYVIIPRNHPVYPFPYNLEDRVAYIISSIKERIKFDIKIVSKEEKDKVTKLSKYVVTVDHNKKIEQFATLFESLGGKLVKDQWVFTVA